MTAFLVIVAVLVLLIALLLSLSATVTVIYDKGWHTTVKFLFIEKEIILSDILSMLIKPDKKIENNNSPSGNDSPPEQSASRSEHSLPDEKARQSGKPPADSQPSKPATVKQNPIRKIWNEEGIVGILSMVSNIFESANSAILTLIRGLHIYSFYVMIIVGGRDAADIGIKYGNLCCYYYPVKGLILNQMRVDNYDDYIQPDFIAPETEFEFQLIGSVSVGLLLKTAIKAGFTFLKNLINNKKGISKNERNSGK